MLSPKSPFIWGFVDQVCFAMGFSLVRSTTRPALKILAYYLSAPSMFSGSWGEASIVISRDTKHFAQIILLRLGELQLDYDRLQKVNRMHVWFMFAHYGQSLFSQAIFTFIGLVSSSNYDLAFFLCHQNLKKRIKRIMGTTSVLSKKGLDSTNQHQ